MRLRFLNIIFQEMNGFFSEIDQALSSGKGYSSKEKNCLVFDSVKTFNNIITVNKIQILRAISQFKPESVYQLAMMLGREPHHVLKDCRQLETFNFINLEKNLTGRNSLRPVLKFDYDVIRTDSPIISPYTISAKSERSLFRKPTAV